MGNATRKIGDNLLLLKVKFLSSDRKEWDYLKGPAEKIEVDSNITLRELSEKIRSTFGIPKGRNHAFYMNNTVRPPFDNVYTDLPQSDAYHDEKGIQLRDALQSAKFKYEYSFSDGLLFQITVEVLDRHSEG